MKLAEALQERADLNKKIMLLKNRLENNVCVQEGEVPAEEPAQLKRELDSSLERLAYLITRINRTNSETVCDDGLTLTEIIAKKDVLSLTIKTYGSIVSVASRTFYRARGSEIKIKATIKVADWQSEIDKMSKELRLLDNKLQEKNWSTDLIE